MGYSCRFGPRTSSQSHAQAVSHLSSAILPLVASSLHLKHDLPFPSNSLSNLISLTYPTIVSHRKPEPGAYFDVGAAKESHPFICVLSELVTRIEGRRKACPKKRQSIKRVWCRTTYPTSVRNPVNGGAPVWSLAYTNRATSLCHLLPPPTTPRPLVTQTLLHY